MIRLVACDLDETLLKDDKTAGKENARAIAQAEDAGVRFVLCTGRPYYAIEPTQKELGFHDEAGRYSITCNGSAIYENKNHRLLHCDGISWELANAFFQEGLKHDVCIQVFTLDDTYAWNPDEDEYAYIRGRMSFQALEQPDIDFLKDASILKILYQRADMDYLHEVEKQVRHLSGDCDVSFSSGRYLEFNKKGVNKGSGMLWLADKLGIDQSETMAIGDSLNDLAMIEDAAIGVGVANCDDSIRSAADVITKADHNHGAVAEALNEYVLNR